MGNSALIGNVPGYLARPAGDGPWPAVIVIQEWWGLDEQTKSIADRFASEGYLAFSPDLYHGELAAIGDNTKAMSLVQKYGPGAPDELGNLYDGLLSSTDCSGKIGSVGFCFGGRMSLNLGIKKPLNAICTFYGGGMQQVFDQINLIKCPVLGLFGDKDISIPQGTIDEFERLLDINHIKHEIIVYPDSGHAFFRDSDPNVYKLEASRDAWNRVKNLFEINLK